MALKQIRQRYANKASLEWERLRAKPITRIEYLITSHCLDRYLPDTGFILDVGSGPGRYAIDLARQGYRVMMFDLVREMFSQIRYSFAPGELEDLVQCVGLAGRGPCRV